MKFNKKRYKPLYIILFCFLVLLIYMIWGFGVFIKENFADVSYYNWWRDNTPNKKEREAIDKILSFLPKDQKVHIYSVNDNNEINENKETSVYKIQFSGESFFRDPKKFDLNLIPELDTPDKNIIGFPYALFHILVTGIDINNLTIPRKIKIEDINNKKFCLFAVSNGNAKERIQFYEELTKYKKVDSCGKVMNNLGYNCPENHESKEYQDFIRQYKFMICFENTSSPNYFTEKLINSYVNGTIPIYWGCPNIDDYVNMSSILYLPPKYNDQDISNLINKIKELDKDDNAYQSYYNSIFFKDGKIPDAFNIEKIQTKMSNMINKRVVPTM